MKSREYTQNPISSLGTAPRSKGTSPIDHFTVVGLVTWLLNGSEAAVDLVLIQTLLFYCADQVVLMLTSCIYMRKAERSVSKQGHL